MTALASPVQEYPRLVVLPPKPGSLVHCSRPGCEWRGMADDTVGAVVALTAHFEQSPLCRISRA